MDADANLEDMNLNDVRATYYAHLEAACQAAHDLRRRGVLRHADYEKIHDRIAWLETYMWEVKYKRDEVDA